MQNHRSFKGFFALCTFLTMATGTIQAAPQLTFHNPSRTTLTLRIRPATNRTIGWSTVTIPAGKEVKVRLPYADPYHVQLRASGEKNYSSLEPASLRKIASRAAVSGFRVEVRTMSAFNKAGQRHQIRPDLLRLLSANGQQQLELYSTKEIFAPVWNGKNQILYFTSNQQKKTATVNLEGDTGTFDFPGYGTGRLTEVRYSGEANGIIIIDGRWKRIDKQGKVTTSGSFQLRGSRWTSKTVSGIWKSDKSKKWSSWKGERK